MTEPPNSTGPAAPPQIRNLPVPVPRPNEATRGEGWLTWALRALFGWRAGSIRADLEVVLEDNVQGETGFSPEERTMLRNILGLREQRVADVMVPRADIVAIKTDVSLADLLTVFESAGHSRLVVYGETLDDPVGMVHIRDVVSFMVARAKVDPEVNAKRKKPFPAGLDLRAISLAMALADTALIRKLLYVPPSMPAVDLLAKMQATRIHLALVVDEYGGTDGLVSIEDLVEQIVGEIDDEHDSDVRPAVVRQPDGTFIADARAPLEEVAAVIGEELALGDDAEEVDTLGGYLVTRVGRVPLRGEIIAGPGHYEIEVLDADPRRVKRLRIGPRKERPPARAREMRRRETAAADDRNAPSPPSPPTPPVETP
ncbi:MAG: HlyC/CorC family transporter [Xanthobacteraceae bacterium]|nr:MAG: HlyC/CorC family transporter [Xanthobacteraceae bacterium]